MRGDERVLGRVYIGKSLDKISQLSYTLEYDVVLCSTPPMKSYQGHQCQQDNKGHQSDQGHQGHQSHKVQDRSVNVWEGLQKSMIINVIKVSKFIKVRLGL